MSDPARNPGANSACSDLRNLLETKYDENNPIVASIAERNLVFGSV
jgi:hypothetical protein